MDTISCDWTNIVRCLLSLSATAKYSGPDHRTLIFLRVLDIF